MNVKQNKYLPATIYTHEHTHAVIPSSTVSGSVGSYFCNASNASSYSCLIISTYFAPRGSIRHLNGNGFELNPSVYASMFTGISCPVFGSSRAAEILNAHRIRATVI